MQHAACSRCNNKRMQKHPCRLPQSLRTKLLLRQLMQRKFIINMQEHMYTHKLPRKMRCLACNQTNGNTSRGMAASTDLFCCWSLRCLRRKTCNMPHDTAVAAVVAVGGGCRLDVGKRKVAYSLHLYCLSVRPSVCLPVQQWLGTSTRGMQFPFKAAAAQSSFRYFFFCYNFSVVVKCALYSGQFHLKSGNKSTLQLAQIWEKRRKETRAQVRKRVREEWNPTLYTLTNMREFKVCGIIRGIRQTLFWIPLRALSLSSPLNWSD